MPYYRVCPFCGSNLDPGEICDCKTQDSDKEGTAAVIPKDQKEQTVEEAPAETFGVIAGHALKRVITQMTESNRAQTKTG